MNQINKIILFSKGRTVPCLVFQSPTLYGIGHSNIKSGSVFIRHDIDEAFSHGARVFTKLSKMSVRCDGMPNDPDLIGMTGMTLRGWKFDNKSVTRVKFLGNTSISVCLV